MNHFTNNRPQHSQHLSPHGAPQPPSYDVRAHPASTYTQAPYAGHFDDEESPKRRLRGTLLAVVVAGLLAVTGGIVTAVLMATQDDGGSTSGLAPDVGTRLEIAADACGISGAVSDGGHTMTLSAVAAEEDPGPVSYTDFECVLTQLDTPQSVQSHMGQTRAMDGMQTNQWDDFEALWTYHPDNGINITITEK